MKKNTELDPKQSNAEETKPVSSENTEDAPFLDKETDQKEKTQVSSSEWEEENGDLEAEEKNQLVKLQDDLAEAKDKYLRLYAEFENYRRRTAQEKTDMIYRANEKLISTLLPVIDDFQRAEKSSQQDQKKNIEGFKLIQNKLQKTLEQFGVEEMETTIGTDFDPDIHEAVTKMPVDEEKLKGKVVDVLEKGYKLHDKVIRYAKIVVGE